MRLAERFHQARFQLDVRRLLDTPPLSPGQRDFTVLSMVHHRDVLAYLLALKSFSARTSPARVFLVADPTLTHEDRSVLREHVPHIEICDASEFRRPGIPVGGCWERLTAISLLARDRYVVQLDADTVALSELDDVCDALEDSVSFTLGTEDGQTIETARETAQWAQARVEGMQHVQGLAESCLDRFDPDGKFRYVRGCAGFAGFSPGSIDLGLVESICARMGELMGGKWSAWGTEQFASNVIVASSSGARVLPHPRYCAPHRRSADTVFLHFIGYVRFKSGLYAELARSVAGELRAAG